jgi:hypothetical protein
MDRMKLHAYKKHSIIHHPVKMSRPWLSLVHSAIAGGGSLRVCLVVDRLILATASVWKGTPVRKVRLDVGMLTDESSVAVAFLSLHLLVDEPERMLGEECDPLSLRFSMEVRTHNVSWEIAKTILAFSMELSVIWPRSYLSHCQADINEQVAAASGDERRCCRREYDGNL